MSFVDIHSHILPGLDDGARDLQQTLAMVTASKSDGISKIVATPHVLKGVFENSKPDILSSVKNVNQFLKHSGLKITILPGAEYHLEPDISRKLAAGDLLTINDTGRYILIELPSAMVPEYTDKILYEIQMQDITPIIAHPERNLGLARKPQLLGEWAKRGILSQVTSCSITGVFGREAKKRALKYLRNGQAQLIASDGHDDMRRAPTMNAAFLEIERLWGSDLAYNLTVVNPEFIIIGKPLVPTVPILEPVTWDEYVFKLRKAGQRIWGLQKHY